MILTSPLLKSMSVEHWGVVSDQVANSGTSKKSPERYEPAELKKSASKPENGLDSCRLILLKQTISERVLHINSRRFPA